MVTDNDALAELGLGPVNQVGFVVRDMDCALRRYEPLFGRFEVMEANDMEWNYRGTPETSTLKVAFAKSGDLEIELIEWVSGETPHKEFLDAGREGMHHLRYIVDDLDAASDKLASIGYQPIWTKYLREGVAASYLERDGDSLIIELYQNKYM